MPGLYVERNMSARRGNCISMNRVTGKVAKQMMGMKIHVCPCSIIKRAAEKAIIIVAIEKKRVERPMIIFLGKDSRKSSSAKRDVRIPKNIKTEVEEENRDRASDIIKSMNNFSCKNIGMPESWPLPPGTVKTAANIIVIMRAPATVQEVDVSFIHCSPSFIKSLWLFVNNSLGVKPSLLIDSLILGGTMLSTSYSIELNLISHLLSKKTKNKIHLLPQPYT